MPFVKKFFFSVPFILTFLVYCLTLRRFLDNPHLLFGIDMQTFLLFVWVVFSVLLTGLFFSLFVTISQDKKIAASSLPAILLCSYLLLPDSSRLIVAIGSFFIFILEYLFIKHTLNTYLSFRPGTLLPPHINRIATFLLLFGSFAFYLSFQQSIQKQGFSLPQPIFDAIYKAIPQDQFSGLIGKTVNPQQFIQSQIQQQVNNLIKPFEPFLPILFAVLFFFNLRFLAAILGLLLGPLINLVFLILDKTKFTTYTTENRPVRKLVV